MGGAGALSLMPGSAGLGGFLVAGGRGRWSSFPSWGSAAGMVALSWGPSWGVLSTTPQYGRSLTFINELPEGKHLP